MRRRRSAVALGAVLLACALPSLARGDTTQTSIFQDDAHLVYASSSTVLKTLSSLNALGVQTIRVTLKWADVAPDAASRRTPAGFGPGNRAAANPAAYGPRWGVYDRLVVAAARHGIAVQFDISAPGPLWAMGTHPPAAKAANHWQPNAAEFEAFVEAAGRRYSGAYGGLPRVSQWSVWNEPNQPGWLAPQWRRAGRGWVPNSPRLYRRYASAALFGLALSGHVPGDLFLIGETAPAGYSAHGSLVAMKPLVFLRALYCVDRHYRPLRGSAASVLGCPVKPSRSAFYAANFSLLLASGFAHHPYLMTSAPWRGLRDGDTAPLADLGRLERVLDRVFRVYGSKLKLPIYLTEYGYQTNPPDPHVRVSPAAQAEYLDAADHLAYRDRRVKAMAQFLLYDDKPDPRFTRHQYGYWDTFQTGLEFAGGRPKPALAAYRLPVWVSGRAVWGQVRPAGRLGAQTALVQYAGSTRGPFHTLTATRTSAAGFFTVRVRPPHPGVVRVAWRSAHGTLYAGRDAAIR